MTYKTHDKWLQYDLLIQIKYRVKSADIFIGGKYQLLFNFNIIVDVHGLIKFSNFNHFNSTVYIIIRYSKYISTFFYVYIFKILLYYIPEITILYTSILRICISTTNFSSSAKN